MYRLLVFAIFLLTLPSNAVKSIQISKCCPLDQKINIAKDSEITCEPSVEKKWLPKIYSPRTKNFTNTPKNWVIKSNFLQCNGTLKSYKQGAAVPTFLLRSNGNLLVVELGQQFFVPEKYCIDSGYALICEESQPQIQKTRVKKCCGTGAVMSELKKSCIVMNGTDYKIDLDDDKSLVEGFPGCSDYVFVGKLHDGKILDDGSLEMNDGKTVIPPNEFCLEHVLENAGK